MRVRSLVHVVAAALLAAIFMAPPAHAGPNANPPPWDSVPTPNPNSDSARLDGVATLGPADAWAVGWFRPEDQSRTLTEHWDGQRWTIVSSPNPSGAASVRLEGVAAASSTAVWAAGNAKLTSGATQTLIERWDGSRWTIDRSPNSGTQSKLHDIAVVSAADGPWASLPPGPSSCGGTARGGIS